MAEGCRRRPGSRSAPAARAARGPGAAERARAPDRAAPSDRRDQPCAGAPRSSDRAAARAQGARRLAGIEGRLDRVASAVDSLQLLGPILLGAQRGLDRLRLRDARRRHPHGAGRRGRRRVEARQRSAEARGTRRSAGRARRRHRRRARAARSPGDAAGLARACRRRAGSAGGRERLARWAPPPRRCWRRVRRAPAPAGASPGPTEGPSDTSNPAGGGWRQDEGDVDLHAPLGEEPGDAAGDALALAQDHGRVAELGRGSAARPPRARRRGRSSRARHRRVGPAQEPHCCCERHGAAGFRASELHLRLWMDHSHRLDRNARGNLRIGAHGKLRNGLLDEPAQVAPDP